MPKRRNSVRMTWMLQQLLNNMDENEIFGVADNIKIGYAES